MSRGNGISLDLTLPANNRYRSQRSRYSSTDVKRTHALAAHRGMCYLVVTANVTSTFPRLRESQRPYRRNCPARKWKLLGSVRSIARGQEVGGGRGSAIVSRGSISRYDDRDKLQRSCGEGGKGRGRREGTKRNRKAARSVPTADARYFRSASEKFAPLSPFTVHRDHGKEKSSRAAFIKIAESSISFDRKQQNRPSRWTADFKSPVDLQADGLGSRIKRRLTSTRAFALNRQRYERECRRNRIGGTLRFRADGGRRNFKTDRNDVTSAYKTINSSL